MRQWLFRNNSLSVFLPDRSQTKKNNLAEKGQHTLIMDFTKTHSSYRDTLEIALLVLHRSHDHLGHRSLIRCLLHLGKGGGMRGGMIRERAVYKETRD